MRKQAANEKKINPNKENRSERLKSANEAGFKKRRMRQA